MDLGNTKKLAEQGGARLHMFLLPGPLILLLYVLFGLPDQLAGAPDPYLPTIKETGQIRAKLDKLRERLDKLWKKAAVIRIPEDRFLDVEIYAKATEWLLRYPEGFKDRPRALGPEPENRPQSRRAGDSAPDRAALVRPIHRDA